MLFLVILFGLQVQGKVKLIKETICEDGYLDCEERSRQCHSDDVKTVTNMLTHCRQTCQRSFEERYETYDCFDC